ncbi:MAG: hypothetical protein LVQ96_04340 [Thermoplasmatales archaeon]|nr:hypothetical protein [Thermoplasmatales archaeon]MCW6170383.1 hypothetical protein [Thermoplasmatales archaeon]
MVTILGSIDNAWKRGHTTNIHHLIFTEDSILIFDVMNKKYIRKETRDYLLSDPLTLVPNTAVESYGTYKDSKIIHKEIIDQAISDGLQIEKNIEGEITKNPPDFQQINYVDIKSITLSQGKFLELPSLDISTNSDNLKYKLMHNNYEKLAHLDEETFNKYTDTLKKAIGDRVKTLD